jgi:hypothetical protein
MLLADIGGFIVFFAGASQRRWTSIPQWISMWVLLIDANYIHLRGTVTAKADGRIRF